MNRLKVLLTLIAVLWLQSCAVADVYNMQGMEGRVVDKATQQPLDGVMVVEAWGIGGGIEGHEIGYLPLNEAETDDTGRYVIPARGTKRVAEGYLTEQSPWIYYFKPGYVFAIKSNRYHPDRRFEYSRRSDWDGKTIELEKFEGTPQEWAKELERFGGVLGNLNRGEWCGWMGIPRTLALLHKEYSELRLQGIRASVAIGAPWVIDELRKCPNSDQFFEAYKE